MNNPIQPQSHTDTEIKRRSLTEPARHNDDSTGRIIECAIQDHRQLDPGLLESIYESALAVEFELRGIRYQHQVEIPTDYRGRVIGVHRLDLIVEKTVLLELKSVERFDPVFEAQVLTYMRIANLTLGLLFNSRLLHEGIERLFCDTYFLRAPVPRWLILLHRCWI